jgi:RNA polymerase sigma factor (sigma-70 family)
VRVHCTFVYAINQTETNEVLVHRAKKGDLAARDQLVKQNLPFVWHEAKKFERRCPFMTFDDFVSEGSIGLLRAIKKYDKKFGCKFLTYAAWWIRAFMERAMQSQGDTVTVPINLRAMVQSGRFTRDWNDLKAKGYSDDKIRKVMCRKRNWTLSVIKGVERILRNGLSLNETISEEGEITRQDVIPMDQPTQLEKYEKTELKSKVHTAIDKLRPSLDARELSILDRRLLAPKEATLQDLAEDLGIVRERVRQIEFKLRGKLERAFLRDKYLNVFSKKEEITVVKRKKRKKRVNKIESRYA